MGEVKKLMTNSAIYGIAPYVPKVVSVFILPLLTAHLTDVDYGIAGTISAYTLALSALATLGMNAFLQVSFFKYSDSSNDIWRKVYAFLQLWMIAFAAIQAVLLYYVMPEEAMENRMLIILLSNFNTVFFGPSAYLCTMYYQLVQKPIPIAVRSIVSGLLTILVNYITIVIFNLGYLGWYMGSFMGQFFVNIAYWYDLNFKLGFKPVFKFRDGTIKHALKVSLPLLPHYYSYYLVNTSNRLVMDRADINIADIGRYNIATQFCNIMESVVSAVERAICPMCMEKIKNDREEIGQKLIYLFVCISFFVTFLFAVWSREAFQILIRNDSLSSAYWMASVLVLSLNYRPMYIAASNIFFYHEKTPQLLFVTFGAGVLAIIANIIFIPRYGVGCATVITYFSFLYQGYIGFAMKPFKENTKVQYPVIKILILQVVVSGVALLLMDVSIICKILFTLIASFVFVYSVMVTQHYSLRTILKFLHLG